jgi:RNA polymerase sigma factor for flagellar operon FliA
MGLAEKRIREIDRDDQASRDWLIAEYLPYVKKIVYRFSRYLPPSVDVDDLINVGVIGLMQAFESFNPEMDNKFITYAVFRIKGAILSELRSRDFLSRKNRKKIRELDAAYLNLERKLGREVDDEELAEEIGIDLEQLYEIKNLSNIAFITFDEFGYASTKLRDDDDRYLPNGNIGDALTILQYKELKSALANAIERLPEKEALVISLYYMDELTMKDIGEVLDISESRVSQIHSRAIDRLKRRLKNEREIKAPGPIPVSLSENSMEASSNISFSDATHSPCDPDTRESFAA